MEHVILLLLIIVLICVSFLNSDSNSNSRTETRKIIPIADIQFSEQNFPSVVYEDIFNGPNVWQGGYNLDQGRPVSKASSAQAPIGYVKSA
jgi:hypothetical protein